MLAKNYSDVRNNFKALCDMIISDGETVIVTRKNDENIVMLSLDEYNNMLENIHIRKSSKNYERLLASREQLKQGKVIAKTDKELGYE